MSQHLVSGECGDQASTVADLAGWYDARAAMTDVGRPIDVNVDRATRNLFSVVRAEPLLGRTFTTEPQPAPSTSTVPVFDVMMPAGGVLSTIDDLLDVLSVAMGYEHSPLAASLERMLRTRRPAPWGEHALGWMITGTGHDQLMWHDGATFGFARSMAWDLKKRTGVVVFPNHAAPVGDIARHLLQRDHPVRNPHCQAR